MPAQAFQQGQNKPPILATYLSRVKSFSPNARLFLGSVMISGVATGITQLLFNFFVLSLGYNEATLGNLVTARSATALVAALPMGYLTDRIGRKNAFLYGYLSYGLSILLMVLFPSVGMLIAMNIVQGLSQSLSGIAMGPFLMENSQQKERTYLFSFASGLRMTATSVGEWLGGYLPTWFAGALAVSAVSTQAYSYSMYIAVAGSLLALIPVVLMTHTTQTGSTRSAFAPLTFMKQNPGRLGKLILPTLVTSIGAGMIMPFMNVFFRSVHLQSDTSIGVILAWGSLAMGVGLLVAPALAERFGKIEVVVATQVLSIPFLALLGFAPWFEVSLVAYYFRLTLMNMSGPIYATFVMEEVKPESRAMIASLTSMASNFGWAFSPTISGLLQVNKGFGWPFGITMAMYAVAITMYYAWFWKGRKKSGEADPAER